MAVNQMKNKWRRTRDDQETRDASDAPFSKRVQFGFPVVFCWMLFTESFSKKFQQKVSTGRAFVSKRRLGRLDLGIGKVIKTRHTGKR